MPRSNKSESIAIGIVAVVLIGKLPKENPAPSQRLAVAAAIPTAAGQPRNFWPPGKEGKKTLARPLDGATTIEICGVGRVAVDPKDPFAISAHINELTGARSAEWLSAMLNSDDNRARAAGLILQGKVGDSLSVQLMTEQSRDALVQRAVGAGDPAVYALAVYACHINRITVPDGACAQVSLSTWAQMDAPNAVPWLLLAQQARVRGDAAAAANAFAPKDTTPSVTTPSGNNAMPSQAFLSRRARR